MASQKITFFLFFILTICNISIAQNQALQFINQADLKQHLSYLASDELLGRELGADNDGLKKAANYLAENAKRVGLKPGGENYFQKVNVVSNSPNENRYLEIKNRKGKSVFHSNSVINLNGVNEAGSNLESEIVLLGFGTDTLPDRDLKDKIVIIGMGNTETFQAKNNMRWNSRQEGAKFDVIMEKKPKALFVITNTYDKENKTFNQVNAWFKRKQFQLNSSKEKVDIPILITTPDFADALLGGKGKYEKYLSGICKNKVNAFLSIKNRIVDFEVAAISKPVETQNVIGIVEGSDPELKNECVVLMAHYDHLGVDDKGDVYNGADDNGSGTVTLMEVAEAFMSLEQKPKRSIVFLWVTGEEVGMLGSQFYVENPVFPLDKTVACINIDMDGRVFESRDTVWNKSPKMVKDFDGLFTLANDFWPGLKEINSTVCAELGIIPDYSLPANFLRSSDHYSLHKNGIPILNYATGYHADYHKVTDEVSRINFDKMKRVADLCFLVGLEIANQDEIEIQNIPENN